MTYQRGHTRIAVDQGETRQTDDNILKHCREKWRQGTVPFVAQGQHWLQGFHHLCYHLAGRSNITGIYIDNGDQVGSFCQNTLQLCYPSSVYPWRREYQAYQPLSSLPRLLAAHISPPGMHPKPAILTISVGNTVIVLNLSFSLGWKL